MYFTILKHAYNYRAENVITEEEQINILRRIVTKLHLEYENEKEFLENILAEISRVKGDLLDLTHYFSVNCAKEVFETIYKEPS